MDKTKNLKRSAVGGSLIYYFKNLPKQGNGELRADCVDAIADILHHANYAGLDAELISQSALNHFVTETTESVE